jgi:hypothetical protein
MSIPAARLSAESSVGRLTGQGPAGHHPGDPAAPTVQGRGLRLPVAAER